MYQEAPGQNLERARPAFQLGYLNGSKYQSVWQLLKLIECHWDSANYSIAKIGDGVCVRAGIFSDMRCNQCMGRDQVSKSFFHSDGPCDEY